MKYTCELCGFVYDEDAGDKRNGIAPGTPFAQLPDYYECRCGYKKEAFNPVRNGQHAGTVRIQTNTRSGIRR